MISLRPLLILDGTIHVEGGGSRADKDRKAGNVIAAGYFRRTRELTILHTPWGRLVDPANLRKVKNIIAQASIDASNFNASQKNCVVESTLIWEHLKGSRLDAVVVWLDRKLRDDNADAKNAVSLLDVSKAA